MRQIAMLRGINLGPNRRVAMADLRALLGDSGYGEVRTYVQSGNVVLDADAEPPQLERELAALIEERFGLAVPVLVRTRAQLARVVRANPLGEAAAADSKRYQVSFLSAPLAAAKLHALEALATDAERFAAHGREIYTWHADGVARSKLASGLAAANLGVIATARNWNTVRALLALAGE